MLGISEKFLLNSVKPNSFPDIVFTTQKFYLLLILTKIILIAAEIITLDFLSIERVK